MNSKAVQKIVAMVASALQPMWDWKDVSEIMKRAFSALRYFCGHEPRALPWAGMRDAFGVTSTCSLPSYGPCRSTSPLWSAPRKNPLAVRFFCSTTPLMEIGLGTEGLARLPLNVPADKENVSTSLLPLVSVT